MANNCLVTKLKAVVDNDNLEKLGVLLINRVYNENDSADNSYMAVSLSSIPEGKSVKMTIVGDGYFTYSYGGASVGKSITLVKNQSGESDTRHLWTSNGSYIIEVENKYDFKTSVFNSDYHVNLADIYYTNIINVSGLGYYGNVSDLNSDKIKSLTIVSSQINTVLYTDDAIAKLTALLKLQFGEGLPLVSTNALGYLTNLEGVNLLPNAKGSIEDFVVIQRISGRTSFSGTLNLKSLGVSGLVTFNGAAVSNVEDGVITWTENTITFRGTTINA